MKTLAILIFSFVLSNGMKAQEPSLNVFPLKDGKVFYSAVLSTEGIAKDELYQRAKRWLVYNCETIKLDDKDIIVGRGQFIATGPSLRAHRYVYTWYTITIQFKDGRYKYDISDFRIKAYDVASGTSEDIDEPIEEVRFLADKYFVNIDLQVKDLIASLDKAMKTPIDDNW